MINNCSMLFLREWSRRFSEIQNTVDILMFCLCTFAVFLNISVINSAIHLFKRNFDTIHVYIISMTIADLFIVSCMMLESLDRLFLFITRLPCSILHFIGWMSWSASSLSLVLLNSDKLLYFCFPLHYRIIKSVRRTVKLCIIAWILSCCFVSYVWLSNILNIGPSKYFVRCSTSLNNGKLHIFTFYTLLVCVLPILSSLIVSCHLLRLMSRKRKHSLRTTLQITSSTSSEEQITLAPAFTRKVRSLVFIFITTVWTAISLLPYRVFVLAQYNYLDTMLADICGWKALWLSQLGWLLHYLLKLNPIVNPCITAFIYHPYRMDFARRLNRHFRNNNSTRSEQEAEL
ncbi:G_PROTEIN_RECEP_F1_2 domain-containing protein [Meloidogyne graminicola]|uniref:G_PROTEIN_RECEP_F1_2 domain-containing protein n=1 Tax=Meloidogyne graminicola TaxID=189291 RepID=A0A8S9ZSH1_9BILA|nr:G_PROTEIN_RECEP_F1_2 domain-containing protein [Meloidogyne graminicola]